MGWEMQLRLGVAAGRLSGGRKGYGTRMTDTIEDEGEFGIAQALRAAQPRRSDSCVPHQLKVALARLALNAAE
jgi:hypothetical protein